MSRSVYLPHMPTQAVEAGNWTVFVRGEALSWGEPIPGWDYATSMEVKSTVDIEVDQVRRDCLLDPGDRIGLVATWNSSSTGVRGIGVCMEVDIPSCEVAFEIDAQRAGGRVTLDRKVVLLGVGRSRDPVAAKRPGSILWSEERSERAVLLLEGEAARFPTERVDFGTGVIGEPDAAWFLDCSFAELEVSPLQAMCLYVNTRHPALRRWAAGATDDVTEALRSVLEWDVARTIVQRALDCEDFIEGWGSFPADSMGETIELLFRRYWPDSDPRALRALREQNPSRFEYTLQARLGLLQDR